MIGFLGMKIGFPATDKKNQGISLVFYGFPFTYLEISSIIYRQKNLQK